MTGELAGVVERFLGHKKALGRKYHSEQQELRLLVRFAIQRGISRLDELTPSLLEDFLGSRPRHRPRSKVVRRALKAPPSELAGSGPHGQRLRERRHLPPPEQ